MSEQIKFKPRSLGWTTLHAAELASGKTPPIPRPVPFETLVFWARHKATTQGIPAKELWLGPKEYQEFEAICRENCTFRVTDADLRGEPPEWQGMIVRRSLTPGVRVGATCGED